MPPALRQLPPFRPSECKRPHLDLGSNECAAWWCRKPRTEKYPFLLLCDDHVLHAWSVVEGEQRIILEREQAKLTEARLAETRHERLTTAGHIYYIRVGDHIKVGYAKNLSSRLMAYPPTATLLASHPGTRKDEQALHSMFTVHRVGGREWYNPTPEILAHIDRVIAEHGAPRVDPFTRRLVQAPKPPPVQIRPRSKWRGGGRVV